MLSLLFTLAMQSNADMLQQQQSSSIRTQISGLMGSTSLACWIVLLMPQLIEQWRLKSADGIAIGFISIWFLGDLFNLVGAIWAGLLSEVIFLAIWFCIADALMISSYFYYTRIYTKHHHRRHHHHHHHHQHQNQHHEHDPEHEHEHEPEPEFESEHPGPLEREFIDELSPLVHKRSRRSSTLTDIAMEPQYHSIFVKYILPILFVIAAGVMGFSLSKYPEEEQPSPAPSLPPDDPIAYGPQIMGYCSAFLYLGARIPQIIQNYERKSVYGLSLLFFLFSTLGNLTYAGQILFYRSDWKYVVLNMSWLLGSLGTILEDSLIFLQFYMYRNNGEVIEEDAS
ncbi:hypothetical protein KGF56_002689 [Candida oxycetoniae]|uniref:Vacuolar amino acid transporter YPQ3 n=1 Tax=Candida oxycetoniae TaxID=497107 RepID=A0AAI9SWN8_9ASCO|nr:uncharacterized protein KGF56_002689 [Candida oxycetoniae]KAI3404497.2 hypothetical protein KGF56_002689 [Candida oxycetoniae]